MDLTPQQLREVELREKFRGYDPDEVDDLLERVAAGLEQLQDRLRSAMERAARAEQRASEGTETEDALRHTLLLAQRTADAAVAEARETAAAMAAEAEQQASAIVAEARRTAAQVADDAQRQLRRDIAALEAARAQLQTDVDALEVHLAQGRDRARAALNELLWRIDERIDPSFGERPAMSPIEVPAPPMVDLGPMTAPPMVEPVPVPDLGRQREPEPDVDVEPQPVPSGAPRVRLLRPDEFLPPEEPGVAEEIPAIEADRPEMEHPAIDEIPQPVAAAGGGAVVPDPMTDTGRWRLRRQREAEQQGNDDYIAVLRSALNDQAPLGPRDEKDETPRTPEQERVANLYDQDLARATRKLGSRFLRRR